MTKTTPGMGIGKTMRPDLRLADLTILDHPKRGLVPSPIQFGIPELPSSDRALSGSSPTDSANGRCGNRALIVHCHNGRSPSHLLGDEPIMAIMPGAIRGMPNWKAVTPDSRQTEFWRTRGGRVIENRPP